jgi:polysaccharide biosynthesis transport protein
MPEHHKEAEPSNLNLSSILLAIFKRKKTILIATAAGAIAAAAVFFLWPHSYESDATLLVRYVLDRSAVDPETRDGSAVGSVATKTTDTFINAEVSILQSWDLAVQVAEALGPKRVLPDAKGNPSINDAAGAIFSGLKVVTTKNSNVIQVSYTNSRPEVAILVLNELVNRYFTKHLEVHRSAGAFDFVSQQTDQVRSRLNQTEDALKALKAKAGILDLRESTVGLTTQAGKMEDELRNAEGDLAEQRARVKLMEGAGPPSPLQAGPAPQTAATPTASASPEGTAAPSPAAQPTHEQIQEYQGLIARVTELRKSEVGLLSKYSDTSSLVKGVRAQIADLENEKRKSEAKFPNLATLGSPQSDLGNEKARLAGLEAKTEILKSQLGGIRERIKQLADTTPQIANLERNKDLEEANYKYFEGSLEKARVDEALDPSKMPNISAVQRASPPSLVTKLRNKVALVLGFGGLAIGLGIALLWDLLLNRTVKRRSELELQLHTPVMVSIPYAGVNGRFRLPWKKGNRNGKAEINDAAAIAPWDSGHFIRPYADAIRDRLGLYFELHGVTHKPKLVGFTGFSEGAGASSLAAGVAAALSETGEGKVLLVDVNASNGEVHPFFEGRPAASLASAIEPKSSLPSAADNLYLATVNQPHAKPAQLGLKKFFAMVPNLKASDFDYIIFDMPPLTQTSPSVGLAALMDKVLLIVEAEKDSRDKVKRGYRELVAARSDVSVVLNKTRSYGPNWLQEGS